MSINMKTLTQALAKTAAVIEKTVQTTVQEVTGPRALQEYDLLEQVGSGGPGLAWKLFSARPKAKPSQAQYPVVCIWLLDKKALSEARTRAGLSKTAEDAFLDVVRADAARLVRLRHPGVVHVVQALDENKTAMAMVTEPLFASVANVLGNFENIAKVPAELKGLEMGLLEIKHGLLQVAESLEFLHTNARLIHRSISPEAVFITSNGAWKLGGFGFAIPADQNSGDSTTVQSFHYAEYDIEDSVLPLQPSLNYTSPELVRNKDLQCGCAADIFSLGCVVYHLLARKPLLDCNNNVKMYMNRLMYLSHDVFSSIPSDLVSDLHRMLAIDSVSRPTALDFTGSPFFRDDTRLRALRFLDHMLERDNMQKSEFLKALSDMWKDFDIRVLRYKVLPPLCAELRNMVMQPMILPMVLTIAESQDRNEFELSTLPALTPVLASAAGETLLLLVKHAELIISKANHEHLLSHVLPLLVRAYDDADVRIQEEVLRKTVCLAKQLDSQLVQQVILPRVHGLALKTTIAAVRVNALLCLGDLIPSLTKHATLDILQTLQRCTAVDRSVPTLMCTLGVANSMYKQYGVEFAAEHVLPLLVPLLISQQLNVQQFGKYMLFVKDILRKIEEKRGVSVSESGASDASVKHSGVNGHLPEAIQKSSGHLSSSTKSTSAWDEDWVSIAKKPASSHHTQESNFPPKSATPTSQPTLVSNTQFQSTSTPDPQVPLSCPAVDIEWPPLAPSINQGSQVIENEKQKSTPQLPGDFGFGEIDPFADWPPRPTKTVNNSLGSTINNAIGMPVPNQGMPVLNATLASTLNNPIGISLPNQGRPALNTSNPTSISFNNPIGLSKPHDHIPSSAIYTNSSAGLGTKTATREPDLGLMFVSTKSEQPSPLRIAPPPPAGKSGGRGGHQGRTDSTSLYSLKNPKAKSEQPSLLDLL